MEHKSLRSVKAWIPLLSLAANAHSLRKEVEKIADLAGVEVEAVPPGGASATAVLNLVEVRSNVPKVRASFHPAYAAYFAEGVVELVLPDEAEDLLELIIAAGTTRRGTIVGVLAASGGAGSSTAAAWLSRNYARESVVTLIDADPLSAGIDAKIGLEKTGGVRWADIDRASGVLVPGRLRASLPTQENLAVLSADERGSLDAQRGARALAALSQVSDVCVLDLPGLSLLSRECGRDILEWADTLILLTGKSPGALARTKRALASVPSGIRLHLACVGIGAGQAAAIAEELEVDAVTAIRTIKGLDGDVAHGLRVGDRTRSGASRDYEKLARITRES